MCAKTFEYNEKTRLKRLICRENEGPIISKERTGKEPKPKKEKKPKSNHSIQSVPLEDFSPEVQVTKSPENRGTVGTHQSLEQLVAQLRANQEKVLNAQKLQEVPNLNEPPQQLNIARIQELSMKTPNILSSPMEGIHQQSPQAPVKSPKKKSRKPPPSYDTSNQPTPNFSVSAQNSINDTTNQGTMNSFNKRKKTMQLKVIVYNKVRKFAGHTIQVVVKDNATVADLKKAIQNETHVPMEIQCIQFAATILPNDKKLTDLGMRSGYIVYSVPTYVEVPNMPNL
ncbi:hypothetical protein WR25_18689 [Diploscapter pachys]|uniref:Ubiquitin-like domain-containing protein n=1 Tax=Diploscapter pachys TaxID=2018661 RepID=A0A2A2KQH0_9BILA|nr:hypothetical protein WR25_18689 [Diploscapter pachys]